MKVNLTNTLCGASLYAMVLMSGWPKEEPVSQEQKITIGSHDCTTLNEVDFAFVDPISCNL